MKHTILFLAVAGTLAIAGAAHADYKRIKTAKQFNSDIVGKKLTDEQGNVFVANADGTISAKLKSGKKFSGTWVWNKKFWCRNGVLDGKALGTDCQLWEIDGATARMTREKGKGKTTIYSINN
ncbi:hypothetical protein LCM27_05555 [Ruegeria marisrubri]|jgi:hypothetical protein|nr:MULTISPECIES: hypothetical protein [Ruegeria]MCA0905858.1 hypothetical protein [Ruegeria marisrubri]QFT71630.1 hypothetical protein FIU92_01195 [Ruegeria sp. THAF33]